MKKDREFRQFIAEKNSYDAQTKERRREPPFILKYKF